MRFRSLLRWAVIFSLFSSIAVCATAQNVQDANVFAQDSTGAVEQQYYVLFRRLVNPAPPNRPQPESTDQPNQPARPRPDFRAMFHRSAHLTDVEARLLDQIAEDCISKTSKLDEQAHEIITARRAELRAGKLPPTTPPPGELSDLQKQRDGVIRNAIEQLRAGFGDAEFKRLNDQVTSAGTSRATLPPPSQKPLQIEVRLALLNSDAGAKPRFSVKDGFTVEVSMMNNSTKMVSIKASELLQWLLLTDPSETDTVRPEPRNLIMLTPALLHPPADEAAIDLPPNQLQVVSRFKFGAGGILIRPGEYQLSVHPRVLLNREPSEFLQLSLAQPIVFEVIP